MALRGFKILYSIIPVDSRKPGEDGVDLVLATAAEPGLVRQTTLKIEPD
jgi:hypothetical protein